MSVFRVQHVLQHNNGLSQDQFVNNWYFTRIAPDHSALQAIAGIVRGFYTVDPAGPSSAVITFMSGMVHGSNARVKIFNLDDAMPRSPVYEEFFTPSGSPMAGGNLPSELAACLSYEAAPASGVPLARRRGRMYIGPLANGCNASGAGSVEATLSTDVQQAITDSAQATAAAAAAQSWIWCLHSPTSALDPPIVSVWCDNAFDVQRRRGIKPSARTTRSIPA